MAVKNNNINMLTSFGFKFNRNGAHTSRTMMLDEIRVLLSYFDNPDTEKNEYLQAIEEDNCLGKRSGSTRKLTSRHLVELYGLAPSIPLFRILLYFWKRDHDGQPLIALLCAFARDSILRSSTPFIQAYSKGQSVTREAMEEFIEKQEVGRFSKATLKSTAQNINSTWTKSGHLQGRVKKSRSQANATPGSVSYALLLGYLTGVRGVSLFQTEYAKLLDCSMERSIELAEEASRKGWIVVKRVGNVVEVLFPNILSETEMEWIREQS